MSNIDLPYILGFREYWAQALCGLAIIITYFVVGTAGMYAWIVRKKGRDFMQHWGAVRFGITSFLFLNMVSIVVKLVLRLAFNVKYIMVTPWINV
jgi:hypothetical protein